MRKTINLSQFLSDFLTTDLNERLAGFSIIALATAKVDRERLHRRSDKKIRVLIF